MKALDRRWTQRQRPESPLVTPPYLRRPPTFLSFKGVPSVMDISVGLRSKADSNPNRPIVPTHTENVARFKYSSGGPVFRCFYGAADKPAVISQQNLSLGSVQRTDVLTSAPGPQRHHVMAGVNGHV